ncbi:MAG: hypothetical protein EAZ57_02410 [Cytophagales bacterium]|nr:MAG: hypothetical protein EAZ67_02870 [Cytophagales bacterium]TAF61619.1 MAG: hypothetical protein EAZ57_02410 [Cytophagales bacterium]
MGDTTRYVGDCVYENGQLAFMRMPEGRIRYYWDAAEPAWTITPQYEYLDHLGGCDSKCMISIISLLKHHFNSCLMVLVFLDPHRSQ